MIDKKLIYTSINFIIGVLNIIIIMPLVLAFGLVILALCLVNIALFIAFVLGVLKIFIPSLPVNFGVSNILLKLLVICIVAIAGYYLYKLLSVFIPQYLSFVVIYMKKSFTFNIV
ncbi:hypothetical protein SAMN02910355_2026 [Terrisporobacter glycolicus]|nr:hypothetical protein SAMN02910355_2026 [Terrisporobacter glycolicus]